MNIKIFRVLLHQFGETVGIPDLSPDEDGTCRLKIGSLETMFKLDHKNEKILLFSIIGNIPADPDIPFFEALLQGNLFWRETFGATLSLDLEGGNVILAREERLQFIDAIQFERFIGDFCAAANSWSEKTREFGNATTESTNGVLPTERVNLYQA
jgi:hypothetical protein